MNSAAIASASYDAASQTLEITFNSGSIYRYASVPPEEAAAFEAATSKGGYFASYIRGKYETTFLAKVEQQSEAEFEYQRKILQPVEPSNVVYDIPGNRTEVNTPFTELPQDLNLGEAQYGDSKPTPAPAPAAPSVISDERLKEIAADIWVGAFKGELSSNGVLAILRSRLWPWATLPAYQEGFDAATAAHKMFEKAQSPAPARKITGEEVEAIIDAAAHKEGFSVGWKGFPMQAIADRLNAIYEGK